MARLSRNRDYILNNPPNRKRKWVSLNLINFLMILGIYAILAKMNGWF